MTHELRFERDFDAPATEVFDAFTSAEGQQAMFRSEDPGWIFHSDIDFRVGGTWRVETGVAPDDLYRFTHTFRAIQRPWLIRFTVTEGGQAGPTFDSEAEVRILDQEGRTHLTYLQHFPSKELRDAHDSGLPGAFDRLDALLRQRMSRGGGGSDA